MGKTDGKMNKAVTMNNCVTLNGGGKRQVKNFTRQEFWKCIGCILLAATYGRKDATFGAKYPKMLVSMRIRHYEEMFVEPPIYRRYVAL